MSLLQESVLTQAKFQQYRSTFEKLQGYIFANHGRDYVHLGLIQFVNPLAATRAKARKFLAQFGKELTTAWGLRLAYDLYQKAKSAGLQDVQSKLKEPVVRAAGLSATGYKNLGLNTGSFDSAFLDGLAKRVQQKITIPTQETLDAILIMAGNDRTAMRREQKKYSTQLRGVAKIRWEEGYINRSKEVIREPFGFADNISQPLFFKEEVPANWSSTWDPTVQPNVILAPELSAADPEELGSFLAYLQIQQDTEAMGKLVRARAAMTGAKSVVIQQNRLVGRTLDGDPLVKVHGKDQNDFDFKSDPGFHQVPEYAHIRKANPRLDSTNRILRRGATYGEEPSGPHGTHFQCFQSNLRYGFEHVFKDWLLNPDHPTYGAGLDAILAGNPYPPARILAGEYFYFPSIPFFGRLADPKFDGSRQA